MGMVARIEVFERVDGKYGFRAIGRNNEIVATDGGQGYENDHDAANTAGGVVVESNTAPIVYVGRL